MEEGIVSIKKRLEQVFDRSSGQLNYIVFECLIKLIGGGL